MAVPAYSPLVRRTDVRHTDCFPSVVLNTPRQTEAIDGLRESMDQMDGSDEPRPGGGQEAEETGGNAVFSLWW